MCRIISDIMKNHLLSDTISVADHESNEHEIRQRLLANQEVKIFIEIFGNNFIYLE